MINVAAVVVSAIAPFFGVEEPLKVTHLLFVNLVMDGLGAIMLGNEPAQERYMSEPPRRRDESIVSKSMMAQIVTMGLWLTALSFIFLKAPFFDTFFASTEQKLSAYFVLFIWSALFNAFNVRSDSFDIFKDLKLNPGFMQVFVIRSSWCRRSSSTRPWSRCRCLPGSATCSAACPSRPPDGESPSCWRLP